MLVLSRKATLWSWESEMRKGPERLMFHPRTTPGACMSERMLKEQTHQTYQRSKFLKCHYFSDRYEALEQTAQKKVEALPFRVTRVTTGWASFTGWSGGTRVCANTPAADAVTSPTTQHPIFSETGLCTGGTVTILARPTTPAHTFTAVTVAVVCKTKCSFLRHVASRFREPFFLFAFKHHQKS